jgi:hypothetical protein
VKAVISILVVAAVALLIVGVIMAARARSDRGDTERIIVTSELTLVGEGSAASEIGSFSEHAEVALPPPAVRRALASAHANAESMGLQPGPVDWSRLRVAFVEAPSPVYLVPTQNGWVCYALGEGSSRCVPSLSGGISWTIVQRRDSEGRFVTSVHGIADDSVSKVVVSIGGRTVASDVLNNAFYVVRRDVRDRSVDSIVVEWSDGRPESVGP